jgi:hypothetical protein
MVMSTQPIETEISILGSQVAYSVHRTHLPMEISVYLDLSPEEVVREFREKW